MKTITVSIVVLAAALGQRDPEGELTEFPGLIEPYRVIQLSPAVDGVLEEVRVDRGDLIKQNQILAQLESSVERATLTIARSRADLVGEMQARKASLDFTERKALSDENLRYRGIVSDLEADQSLTEKLLAEAGILQTQETMKLAELEYERAHAALELRTIKSPITGVVVDRLLSPGELATRQAQSIIFVLAQIDPLNVEITLPVDMIGRIKVGDEAQVLPQEPIAGSHQAKVTVVDHVVEAESGTFRVRLQLPNPDYKLPAGIQCNVRFSDPN
jgi:RND family efflux transporter MFP subunit